MIVVGSAESLEAQIDEKEALEAIYDELVHIKQVPSQVGDPTLRFTILLSSPDLPPKVGENAKIILYSAISLFRWRGSVAARSA